MNTYKTLCKAIQDHFRTVTIAEYIHHPDSNNVAIIRHDVDHRVTWAYRMACCEKELGICSTYYFRYPGTFSPEIIHSIESMGHEVGYHYEVLSKAGGDPKRAITLFARELEEFRKFCTVRTICMHGSPLSRYDNRDLWSTYDFRKFNISGEAYLSIKEIPYYSDTGRSWSGKNNIRDFLPQSSSQPLINTTDDLICLIRDGRFQNLYLCVHTERWANNTISWISSWLMDTFLNFGKEAIMVIR